MKRKVTILLSIILLFPSEILGQRAISDEIYNKYYMYQRPKCKFKFARKKNIEDIKAISILPIDTNSIYISRTLNESLYIYIRFFSGGEVFISHEYRSMPSEQECNDLSYGIWGMFAVNGNELIIETYVRGFPSKYWYSYLKTEKNKLTYYKCIVGRWNRQTEKMNLVKEKKSVKLTNYTINW